MRALTESARFLPTHVTGLDRIWYFFLTSFLLIPSLFAQVDTQQDVIIELSSILAVPGTQAQVPLVLFLEETSPAIKEIAVSICVSDEFLEFLKVEPGMAARAVDARVTAARGQKEESGCVPIMVEAAFEKSPDTGTVANLFFEVKRDAPIDQSINLEGEYQVTDTSGEIIDVPPFQGAIQVVKVLSVFACFFYMH